jgi:hypothetical protein
MLTAAARHRKLMSRKIDFTKKTSADGFARLRGANLFHTSLFPPLDKGAKPPLQSRQSHLIARQIKKLTNLG